MRVPQHIRQIMTNSTWVMLGAGCMAAAFVLWIMQVRILEVQEVHAEEEQEAQQAARPVQTEAIGLTPNLGNFSYEVPAMNVVQRETDNGQRAAEFRGAKFVAENKKAWTLQLIKVSEEDIILSYLDKREDRKDFHYLRLQDGKNPEQYVLLYGKYNNIQLAMEQLQKQSFDLPATVKIVPEKISTYAPLVNDLGSDEIASGAKLRDVVLTKAALPKVMDLTPKPAPTPIDTLAGTSTTVQRKDQDGNVKSTQTENSTVAAAKKEVARPNPEPITQNNAPKPPPKESQIVDPFQ